MENISYIGLSQQLALQQQMEITANNIANIDTPGFKSQNVLFVDYLARPKPDEDINQVINFGTYRDLSAGSFSQTGNPLDVALQGDDAYFTVQTPQGVRYTRDGSFGMNVNRELVNQSGYHVLDDGGAPITIPEEATHITITADGAVATQDGVIAVLGISGFADPQYLQRTGENLYDATAATPVAIENPRVAQGVIEQSNVNAVLEMNKMITVLRSFQMVQKMLQNDHERIRGAIQKLTQV